MIKILFGLEAADGGTLQHIIYLVTHLNPCKFEITVIISNSRKPDIGKLKNIFDQHNVTLKVVSIYRHLNLVSDAIALTKLIFEIKKSRYDVVHSHSSKAGLLFRPAAWICRTPLILYTPHCFYFQAFENGIKRIIYLNVERILASICHGIIVSQTEKTAALNARLCTPEKLTNINNAINFNPNKISLNIKKTKAEFGICANIVIGSIGRLTKQKDWPTFIYAAKEVLREYEDVTFLITGSGPLKQELIELAKYLEIEKQLIFTGYVNEIHDIYAILDIFVSTSLWEGLPYTFLEAMHYQKPLVISDIGHEEIIEHGKSGLLFPKKNHKMLAKRQLELIRNKTMALNLGQKGSQLIQTEKYSFQNFVRNHEELYLSKLAKNKMSH